MRGAEPTRGVPLERIFKPGKLAFIPYIMAGDPDRETTSLLLRALTEAGADAIELGIPYGDPLADGPTIAAAGMRALQAGTRLADVLELVREYNGPPIILFTYYNPVLQYGIERFTRDAKSAGAAGIIVPDIPLEEDEALRAAVAAAGLEMPLLVAPSTPPDRAAKIAERSTGFVYVVSRLGVTGARSAPDFTPLQKQISMLREITNKPLAVGFGISSVEHIRAVRGLVDGVIVGSALIDSYEGARGKDAAARAKRFTQSLIS